MKRRLVSTYSFNAMRSTENKTKTSTWPSHALRTWTENDRTLENITELVRTSAGAQTPYDGCFMQGFGYDFHEKQGTVGDNFMEAMSLWLPQSPT